MIYFAQPTDGGPVKIGFTDDIEQRHRQLEAHYGRDLVILATMKGGRAKEAKIHERFARLRLGRTEQFRPGPELMGFIGRPLLVGANPDAVALMESDRRNVVSIRGTESWRDWLMGLAAHRRLKASDVIDQALIDYAHKHGYTKEAPPR